MHNIKPFLTSQQIKAKVVEIAAKISRDYTDKPLLVIGLMKGCIFFLSDLMRELKLDNVELDVMLLESYIGNKSTGNVKIILDSKKDIFDKDILIVDDILDTGTTLDKIKSLLLSRGPKSLEFCVLFDKVSCRKKAIDVKYIGFEVPNYFFVGFGMDYNNRWRELPYLGILENIDN